MAPSAKASAGSHGRPPGCPKQGPSTPTVHPFESGELDALETAPRAAADDLGLEQADDALGLRTVIAVADAAYRGLDALFRQALSVTDGPRHRPIRRPMSDHDFRRNVRLATPPAARPRHTQSSPGPQAGRHLPPECGLALHMQRLIDRHVADAHALVVRRIEPQPTRNLLRAPRLRSPSVLPLSVPTPLPGHCRRANRSATRAGPRPCRPAGPAGSVAACHSPPASPPRRSRTTSRCRFRLAVLETGGSCRTASAGWLSACPPG